MIRRTALFAAMAALFAQTAPAQAPVSSPLPELRGGAIASGIRPIPAVLRLPPLGIGQAVAREIIQPATARLRPLPRPAARPADGAGPPAQATRAAFSPARPVLVHPRPRPDRLDSAIRAVASAGAVATPASPLAVQRSVVPPRRSETARLRHLQLAAAAVRSQPAPGTVTGRDSGALCGVRGIQGTTIPPITSNVNACGIASPVRVTAVDGVRLSQAAILDCTTARALHEWVRDGVRPAVGATGGGPETLRVAAHYSCRTRNNRAGAPISEHGKGKAIDISAIGLASGEVISVLHGWRDAYQKPILRAMHRAACGTFGTTLGPGSDGYHEDHFHYDSIARRTPYCR